MSNSIRCFTIEKWAPSCLGFRVYRRLLNGDPGLYQTTIGIPIKQPVYNEKYPRSFIVARSSVGSNRRRKHEEKPSALEKPAKISKCPLKATI